MLPFIYISSICNDLLSPFGAQSEFACLIFFFPKKRQEIFCAVHCYKFFSRMELYASWLRGETQRRKGQRETNRNIYAHTNKAQHWLQSRNHVAHDCLDPYSINKIACFCSVRSPSLAKDGTRRYTLYLLSYVAHKQTHLCCPPWCSVTPS